MFAPKALNWLKLLNEGNLVDVCADKELNDRDELVRLLTSIVK
jgi:hypothetical protein